MFAFYRHPKLRRIRALAIKELFQVIRDPSSIMIAVVFPLLLLFIYGYGISLDMNHLKIGIVMEDSNPDVQSFIASMKGSKFFDVTLARNQEELKGKLVSGELHGIVTIPFYFSEYAERDTEKGPLFVIADGSSPNTASFVQNYLAGAYANWIEQQAISNATPSSSIAVLAPRFWYNEELSSHNFLVPGSIAIIMTLIGTLLTALVISREWERGTMEALMATPVTITEILFGKLLPYFCLGIFAMMICAGVGHYVFGVPFRGSFFLLMLSASCFLLAALSIGLLISSFARNQFTASQIALISAFLPAFMLSGFVFEISSMPMLIQWITYLLPARYFVSSLQTLFLCGNVMSLVRWNILCMLLFSVVVLLIIKASTKKRLD